MEEFERLAQMDTRNASNDIDHDVAAAPPVIQIPEVEMMAIISKDPVLITIFDVLDKLSNKRAVTYIKLSFTKLAAIRELKEECREQADLLLSLQNMHIDASDCSFDATDGPCQRVNKASCAMRMSNANLAKGAATKLTQLIRDSKVQIPRAYRATDVDDLCAVWYAISSDRYYQYDEVLAPCIEYGFRVLVVTHLHLVGGTPSHFEILQRPQHMQYQQFLDLLPDFLSVARCKQAGRLGYSAKAPTTGPWKYQIASSLGDLELECWEELGEAEYENLKGISKQVIFLIHADDIVMPLRIAAKVQRRPVRWNTWFDPEIQVITRDGPLTLPPPNLLPGPLSSTLTGLMDSALPSAPTIAGRPGQSSLPSRSVLKRSSSNDGQQESKRSRDDDWKN